MRISDWISDVCSSDLQEAQRRLPKWLFESIDRGSEDEWATAHNRVAYQRLKLRNRVLVDMTGRDLGTTLFDKEVGLPLAIAPTGIVGLCWYEGELALARAAAKMGVPYTLATNSITPLERLRRTRAASSGSSSISGKTGSFPMISCVAPSGPAIR